MPRPHHKSDHRRLAACLLISVSLHDLLAVSSFGPNYLLSRQLPPVIVSSRENGRATSSVLWENSNSIVDSNPNDLPEPSQKILCDLQTLLRLAQCVSSGGEAKMVIQSGDCLLNGQVETRRAKKLFSGDVVRFQDTSFDVQEIVDKKGYVYKSKQKKGI
jgi:ribosome-associated protein